MSLTGAINIGLSGMNAYSDGLQVISNNVANLNTLGYKEQTVTFNDIMNNGGGGLSYLGENSAGDGVTLNPTGTDFGQGTLEQTGNALDLAVDGSGFLVLQSSTGQTYYTRTGSFGVDSSGNISLQGQAAGSTYHLAVLNGSNEPVPVDINANKTSAPTATTTITLRQNLSSTATTDSVSNITVYDSTGDAHTWTVTLTPATSTGTSTETTWNVAVTDETGAAVGSGTLKFNGTTVDPATSKITINDQPTNGAAALAVTLDFSSVTSFDAGSTSTLQTASVNGNAAGTLSTVTVNSSGDVLLTYSNSLTKSLGAVAIADFQTPSDLESLGGGLYANSKNSNSILLSSGAGNGATVVSGQLEQSNVNLTNEFGDLILIQRGFQAASQVVSVSNDMIQQLFGIRGQGG